MIICNKSICIILAIACFVLVVSAQHIHATGSSDKAVFVYEKSEETILLEMRRTHSEIADDDMFTIQVCGDGTVKVHYPIYMKRAGDYRLQLSAQALQNLLQSMSDKGLFDLDLKILKTELRQAQHAQNKRQKNLGAIRYRSSDTITYFSASLDSYRPSTQREVSPMQMQLSWYGLQSDAKDFDVAAIDALAQVERELLALAEAETLKKEE